MRVGVTFSIPIEEALAHTAEVLKTRAPLDEISREYARLVKTIESSTTYNAADISRIIPEISNLRKNLLSADQALEDTTNIVVGYLQYLQQEEEKKASPDDDPVATEQEGGDDD